MNEHQVWYLYTHEGQAGPNSSSDIQLLLSKGKITYDCYVWCEGQSDWALLRDIAEFQTRMPKTYFQSSVEHETTSMTPPRVGVFARVVRAGVTLAGAFLAVYMIALLLEMTWAKNLWLRPGMPYLAFVFVASIAASFAAPLLWIAWSGELAALRPLAAYGLISCGGTAAYLLMDATIENGPAFSLFFGAAALFCALLLWLLRKFPILHPMPSTPGMRKAFWGISAILIPVGIALTLCMPHLFPFPLSPLMSVIYGLIFIGAGVYGVWGARSSDWQMARGQLLGVLAYDLVLIVPYAGHFRNVDPENFWSLAGYVTAIAGTALFAVVQLIKNRK